MSRFGGIELTRGASPLTATLVLLGFGTLACRPPAPEPAEPLVQPGVGFYQEVSWAPDGAWLLVSVLELVEGDPGFTYRIWKVDPDGGDAGPISSGPRDYWTSWSPDGARIVFAGSTDGTELDLYTIAPNGADRRRLTSTEAADTQPDWAPDGRRIAFVSYRASERGQLWVMRADGSDATRLLESAGEAQNPVWSPDGGRIAFYETDGAGDDRIFVVGADGSDPVAIAEGLWPTWTPDGLSIIYGGEGGLFRISADGGDPTLLIAGEVLAGELSRDGRRLAYILEEGDAISVVVSEADGGRPRTLMTRPRPEW